MNPVCKLDFARLVGVSRQTIYNAIKNGRLQTIVINGQEYIDTDTQLTAWENNRTKETNHSWKETEKSGKPTKVKAKTTKPKTRTTDFNKLEKHIGSTEIQDTYEYEPELSDLSTFDKILDIDADGAPPKGSVAYHQAHKLAIDAVRNYLKLLQEAGEVIAMEDAVAIYGEILANISASVQNIPARVTSLIASKVKKSVKQWSSKEAESALSTEINNIISSTVRSILTDIVNKQATASKVLKDGTRKKNKQR